jgi:Cytochrome C'
MSTSSRWQVVGLSLFVCGLALLVESGNGTAADAKAATSMYKPVVPDDVLTQLLTDEGKALREAVGKASDKKMASKARSIAFIIAVYAQGAALRGGSAAADMAALRDTALKLAKAVADGKLDDAKTLAATIQPGFKAQGAATPGPASVHQDFEIDTLMLVFKPAGSGGLEWNKKLDTLINKRGAYTPAEYKQAIALMYRIAALAQPTEAFAPAPMGKKTPEEWIKLSREMGVEAVAAAELAKKPAPDAAMVKAAIKRVEATCASCHDKFRD